MNTVSPMPLQIQSAWHRIALALSSGLMLGFSFPPSPIYSLAYVGLIPFLLLIETIEGTWRTLRYSYLTLFVFHTITLYWIGGFVVGKDVWMMVAGGAVLLFHPMFYLPVILLYRWVRRKLGLIAGLIFFPLAWISYEYSHSLTEFSFPWITLGNSQAYDLARIQIAEFTSTYGLSFLILLFNAVGFVLVSKLATRSWAPRSRAATVSFLALLVIYFAPWFWGKVQMSHYSDSSPTGSLQVGVIQPNIDPWEKWGAGALSKWNSYDEQLKLYVRETSRLAAHDLDLITWPETAIPFRILMPIHRPQWLWLRASLDSSRVPVLTGLPFVEYYDSLSAPISSNRDPMSNRFYDDFNSTTLLIPGKPVGPIYKKMVLVPFAERIPYADDLSFLIKPLEWNVGIGMWGKGRDTVLFSLPSRPGDSTIFASMICYESVYPNFVREFVRLGARFLVIMTNDSWWGNTSGAYQHASYASLRAVETRRWIVRTANGGISGLIDPSGTYHYETRLYTSSSFYGTIQPRTELTFYAAHGDLFAQLCVGAATFILLITLIPQRKQSEAP